MTAQFQDVSPFTSATEATVATSSDAAVKQSTTTSATNTTTNGPAKFPYPILMIGLVLVVLALIYVICRWRQKGKNMYIIPRIFVLCSPRTVQFHYELILRVGLPSYDFNPDKHDIDLTILGQQKNEVVPMTRLNTKTLLDEPLITSMSIVAYRLVEMPPLGGLVLRHSGPFKSWLYAYDFTLIDLATNKEQYYALNQYIGAFERVVALAEPNGNAVVHYPIDDVPLPQWSLEDIFLILYAVVNCIMLVVTKMPLNCTWLSDILSIFLAALVCGSLLFFLEWLLYYQLKWNQERKEYFSDYETSCLCPRELLTRVLIAAFASAVCAYTIYLAYSINDWKSSLVWLLSVLNTCTLVIGIWNVTRQMDFGEGVVAFGLKMRGVEMAPVGMRYSEMVADIRTKSGSTSDDGIGSNLSRASKINRIAPRSTVKSLGFDPLTGRPSSKQMSRLPQSRISATGATPNNQPNSQILFGLRQLNEPGSQAKLANSQIGAVKSKSDSEKRRQKSKAKEKSITKKTSA